MKKAAVVGISGKMGVEVQALAKDFAFDITCGVARNGTGKVSSAFESLDPALIDVVIDFSLPALTKNVAAWCAANRRPLVSGVTGLGAAEKEALMNLSQMLPVFWAPNMSLGIAVLARMLEQASRLKGFDFQIEEIHHKGKKDSPSGTALFLQEKLEQIVEGALPPPIAVRGGGVFGVHRVFALGEDETITLEHSAMSRRVFARGALQAARWLLAQAPGLYSMDHLLGT